MTTLVPVPAGVAAQCMHYDRTGTVMCDYPAVAVIRAWNPRIDVTTETLVCRFHRAGREVDALLADDRLGVTRVTVERLP